MIQVICGEVEEWFVYTTDNLLDGGANAIIEVLRQALFDLDRFVRAKYKCGIPKKGDLQYDNGSENKVLSLTKAVAINNSFFCFQEQVHVRVRELLDRMRLYGQDFDQFSGCWSHTL